PAWRVRRPRPSSPAQGPPAAPAGRPPWLAAAVALATSEAPIRLMRPGLRRNPAGHCGPTVASTPAGYLMGRPTRALSWPAHHRPDAATFPVRAGRPRANGPSGPADRIAAAQSWTVQEWLAAWERS